MEQSFVATSVKQLPHSEPITSPVSVLVQHKYPKLRPPQSRSLLPTAGNSRKVFSECFGASVLICLCTYTHIYIYMKENCNQTQLHQDELLTNVSCVSLRVE